MEKTSKQRIENAAQKYSGVATDNGDNCKDNAKIVDNMTKMLNNNHAGDSDYQETEKG